jgi:hypothetical protein
MLVLVVWALSLTVVDAHVQDAAKPRITPFFSRTNDSPAFYVECRNETGSSVSSASAIWAWAANHLRIDGTPFVESGGIIGPGLSTQIEPGGTWRGIVTLHQSTPDFSPAVAFGANTRGGRIAPLSPGRHTIAVQCGDQWSDDHVFYWEPDARR